jgi:hypothetical protein
MRMPLYFHIRNESIMTIEDNECIDFFTIPDMTICVDLIINPSNTTLEGFKVGYSVVHENDQFNKRKGRNIAKGRMDALSKLNQDNNARVHNKVMSQINKVLSRACELLDIQTPVDVEISGSVDSGKRAKKCFRYSRD